MALEPFAERFPDRFFNVGVAEQNLVGLATGLAEAGFVPYVYSIATFATLRPYEFIRSGPLLHGLPVRIVGMGGGFEYSTNGLTHFALEDVGVLRIQPGLAVFAPADPLQTRSILTKTAGLPGPAYYRLGKDDTMIVPGLAGRFDAGEVQLLREGADVLVLAMGSVAVEAEKAVAELRESGLSAGFGVVACLNPAPRESLGALVSRYRAVVTVEAHYVDGGLGSLTAESIAEGGCEVPAGPVRRRAASRRGGRHLPASPSGVRPLRGRDRRARQESRPRGVLITIILPVRDQADHIGAVVREYVTSLERVPVPRELLLVENGSRDASRQVCLELAREFSDVRAFSNSRPGWGSAVRAGLAEARGDLICYTNSARTSPEDLVLLVLYALAYPDVVVKANRKVRESLLRRFGSLLYNLECRALFDLPSWDVNGTPKVFPRSAGKLLGLTRDDDLIDLEFSVIVRREQYRMIEIPLISTRRHGGRSTTRFASAFRLYTGALAFWRRNR